MCASAKFARFDLEARACELELASDLDLVLARNRTLRFNGRSELATSRKESSLGFASGQLEVKCLLVITTTATSLTQQQQHQQRPAGHSLCAWARSHIFCSPEPIGIVCVSVRAR